MHHECHSVLSLSPQSNNIDIEDIIAQRSTDKVVVTWQFKWLPPPSPRVLLLPLSAAAADTPNTETLLPH